MSNLNPLQYKHFLSKLLAHLKHSAQHVKISYEQKQKYMNKSQKAEKHVQTLKTCIPRKNVLTNVYWSIDCEQMLLVYEVRPFEVSGTTITSDVRYFV